MTVRKFRKKTLLAKIETTYGQDPTPTGAANAIETFDLEIDDFQGNTEKADIDRPTLGNAIEYHVGIYVMLRFKVRLAGAGSAGGIPAFGPLLRMCGWGETNNVGVSTVYGLVSANEESGTLYYNMDGHLWKLLGARGNVKPMLQPGKFPYLEFEIQGLRVAPAADALPTVDISAFKTPVPVNDSNTSTLTLDSYACTMSDLSLDQGNDVTYRNVVGEESIQIVDRAPSGSITIDEPPIATKDFYAIAEAHTLVAFQMVHGQTAGNIVQVDMPKVQLMKPKITDVNGIASLQMGMNIIPNAGDDEMVLTIK